MSLSQSEKKEEMATTAYMVFTWHDDRLKYDASRFGGVNVSRIPADDLWVPDLILQNRYSFLSFLRRSLKHA